MTDFEYLRFDRDDDVLVVTVDKPDDDLNKVDEQMHHELTHLFKHLRNERDCPLANNHTPASIDW